MAVYASIVPVYSLVLLTTDLDATLVFQVLHRVADSVRDCLWVWLAQTSEDSA